MQYEKILLKNMETPGYTGALREYEQAGGYAALREVWGKVPPADIIEIVKK
jgi:NADH:ubiquinone oxidoreductase subunit F (NADH-binding)